MYCTFKLSSSKINNSKVHIHVTFHFQKNPTFLFSLCADKPFLRKLVGAFGSCFWKIPVWIATGMPFPLFDYMTRFFTCNTATFSIVLCHTSEVGFSLQISGPQNYCSFNSDWNYLTLWFNLKTCIKNKQGFTDPKGHNTCKRCQKKCVRLDLSINILIYYHFALYLLDTNEPSLRQKVQNTH